MDKAELKKALKEIIAQLEWCNFECVAGPLGMNLEFQRLKKIAEDL